MISTPTSSLVRLFQRLEKAANALSLLVKVINFVNIALNNSISYENHPSCYYLVKPLSCIHVTTGGSLITLITFSGSQMDGMDTVDSMLSHLWPSSNSPKVKKLH